MAIYVQCHGPFKDALPKGQKRKHYVYAETLNDTVEYLKQFPDVAELLNSGSFEMWVGGSLSKARSLTAEQVADPRWKLPEGTTVHFTPHVSGNEITTAMIITALITAAVNIAVSLLTNLLFPPSQDDTGDTRKSVLYQGGLNTQKEGIPLSYVAGRDVLCGSNLIEGIIEYTRTNGTGYYGAPAYGGSYEGLAEFLAWQFQYGQGYEEFSRNVMGEKGGGGKSMKNTFFTDATLRALFAYADGPVSGILGDTPQDKEKHIFINEVPLRDPTSNNLNYQGFSWEERIGEVGQANIALVPYVANNQDRNIELKKLNAGGAQIYLTEMVSNADANRAKVRIRINGLVDSTDKKGNQKATSVAGGIEVKREGSGTWLAAGQWGMYGKSSESTVIERDIIAPPAGAPGERWQFRVYRTTADSNDDKLSNATAFDGFVEYQDVDLTYDGAENDVPTALFGIKIDLSQFDQGGSLPELCWRAAGRRVRVPSNYNPVTRTYTGNWDGSWNTAATDNPVWHWFHLATSSPVGAGLSDDLFNKWSLYQIAKYNDGLVNGRPRYTLNKQFTDEQEAWPFLVELASSFRAFPYWTGSQIILVQDVDVSQPDLYVNNTMVDGGTFSYQSTSLSQRYNVVRVEWDNPADFFRKYTEEYRDEESIARNKAQGLSANGELVQTYYKIGCTNKQEAYDFARLLCYVSQNETETVTFDTLVGAAAYAPGQIIAVDDWTQSGKTAHGRLTGVNGAGKPLLDQPWLQKANTAYKAYIVLNNALVIRNIAQVSTDTTHSIVDMDATGVFEGMPCGVIEVGGVEPVWYRISDIQDAGAGKYTVTALEYARGKHAWVEQNVPAPNVPFTLFNPKRAIPAPTGLTVAHSFEQDDLRGSIHSLTLSWERDNDPALMIKGFLVEVLGPDGDWRELYEGPNTIVSLPNCAAGKYVFTVKAVNTFNKSSDIASTTYTLAYGEGDATVLPPMLIGLR